MLQVVVVPIFGAIVLIAAAAPFEQVGIEGGAAPEAVTALLQDNFGFIWIGSRHGLLRYDGVTHLSGLAPG